MYRKRLVRIRGKWGYNDKYGSDEARNERGEGHGCNSAAAGALENLGVTMLQM